MFSMFLEGNMEKALQHLLTVVLRKSNVSSLIKTGYHQWQHTSARGIVTDIRGYTTFKEYNLSGDDDSLQRCNGFFFTLKRVS